MHSNYDKQVFPFFAKKEHYGFISEKIELGTKKCPLILKRLRYAQKENSEK